MTDNAAGMAEMLRLGAYVCFALALLFLIATIVLFFRLNIRDVLYELSGRAKSESIQKMKADYAVTGSLSSTSKHLSSEADDQSRGLINTGQLPAGKSGLKKTKSVQLKPGPDETTALRGRTTGSGISFVVTKDIAVVHTEERLS